MWRLCISHLRESWKYPSFWSSHIPHIPSWPAGFGIFVQPYSGYITQRPLQDWSPLLSAALTSWPPTALCCCCFLRFYLFIFRETGEERERGGGRKGERERLMCERSIDRLHLTGTPTRDLAHLTGMSTDWESDWELNWWPFALWNNAHPTESHADQGCQQLLMVSPLYVLLQNRTSAVLEQLWGLIAHHWEAWLPMQEFGEKGKGLFI